MADRERERERERHGTDSEKNTRRSGVYLRGGVGLD
jgi:hypothetical protein